MGLIHFLDEISFYASTHATPWVIKTIFLWVFIYAYIKRNRTTDPHKKSLFNRIFIVALSVFMGLIILEIFAAGVVNSVALYDADQKLGSKIFLVQVNGKPFPNPEWLINDIRELDASPKKYHHSYPTENKIDILISTQNGDLHLILARDSDSLKDSNRPTEYWVFDKDFLMTSCVREIGKVSTSALDKIIHPDSQ